MFVKATLQTAAHDGIGSPIRSGSCGLASGAQLADRPYPADSTDWTLNPERGGPGG